MNPDVVYTPGLLDAIITVVGLIALLVCVIDWSE